MRTSLARSSSSVSFPLGGTTRIAVCSSRVQPPRVRSSFELTCPSLSRASTDACRSGWSLALVVALSFGARRSDRSSVRLAAWRVRFSCEQVRQAASPAPSCCVARFEGCRTAARSVLASRRSLIVMRYMPVERTGMSRSGHSEFQRQWRHIPSLTFFVRHIPRYEFSRFYNSHYPASGVGPDISRWAFPQAVVSSRFLNGVFWFGWISSLAFSLWTLLRA